MRCSVTWCAAPAWPRIRRAAVVSKAHSARTHRVVDNSQVADSGQGDGAQQAARVHRAVVRLSEVDARRVESGELKDAAEALQRLARGDGGATLPHPDTPTKKSALKKNALGATTVAPRDAAVSARDIRMRDIVARTAHEQSILDERPPHFGKL